ncbi:unnamed protein product [Caenorhabditis angaria]|uniref:Uncharacterized protein n=1 Tax=Caenorhabditis angaria TaxID=860376 RepID=A0A9P1IS62_9PELO|nr:unnamed protein product [Caenorhabditis angaria]
MKATIVFSILVIVMAKSIDSAYPNCKQRPDYTDKKFGKTLFLFPTTFYNVAEDKKKNHFLYILKQISCSIPNNRMFHYGVYSPDGIKQYNQLSDVQNHFKTLTEGKSCNETFERIYNEILPSDYNTFDRVELFYRHPELDDCDFLEYYRKGRRLFRLNFISFDDDYVEVGFNSLNFPNISKIDTNREKATEQLANMTILFINNILGIEKIKKITKLEPVFKCIDQQDDYYIKLGIAIGFILGFALETTIYLIMFDCCCKKKAKKHPKQVNFVRNRRFHHDDLGELSGGNFDDTYGPVKKVTPKDGDQVYEYSAKGISRKM